MLPPKDLIGDPSSFVAVPLMTPGSAAPVSTLPAGAGASPGLLPDDDDDFEDLSSHAVRQSVQNTSAIESGRVTMNMDSPDEWTDLKMREYERATDSQWELRRVLYSSAY